MQSVSVHPLPLLHCLNSLSVSTGYYADVEARCQVFRVCANTDLTGQGFAFLCPNGTLFNQRFFVCDWYNNVENCATSEQYYDLNEKMIMDHEQMMEKVKQMIQFPLTQPFMGNQITTTTTVSTGLPTMVTESNNFPPPRPPTTTPESPFFFSSIQPLRLPNVFEKDLLPPGATYPGDRAIVDTFTTTSTSRPFQETYQPHPPVQPSVLTPGLVTPSPPPPVILPESEDENKENTNAVTQNEQKVYVSSLGELSTDVNSGFDINKSRFLVVDGDSNGEEDGGGGRKQEEEKLGDQRATAGKEHLEKILEEQVALVGQSININGLTQQAQINSALLASTNRFAIPLRSAPFLPRLIASNVIVPLPKGFSKNKKQGDNQSLDRLQKQQEPSSFTERPTYTASGFDEGTSGQFPAERFSFPAAGHLPHLPLSPPEAPAPFTAPPLLVQFGVDDGTENPLPTASTGQSQTDLGLSSTASTLPSRFDDEVVHRGERISLSSSFQVDPLREQQGNNDELVENVNEKQIFTYPFAAKSQVSANVMQSRDLSEDGFIVG